MTVPTNDDFTQQWRESVESRLVSLTSAQKVTDNQLDDQDLEIAGMLETLNGAPKEHDRGLVAQVNALESTLKAADKVISNALSSLSSIEIELGLRKRDTDNHWKFWTAIIGGLLTLAGILIINWDKVSPFFSSKTRDPVHQIIEKANHPRGRQIRKQIIKFVPEEGGE